MTPAAAPITPCVITLEFRTPMAVRLGSLALALLGALFLPSTTRRGITQEFQARRLR